VEVLSGVEPEPVLHLPAAGAVGEDVGVQGVRLAGDVAQELQVDLVMDLPLPFRNQLRICSPRHSIVIQMLVREERI
jgi:hypothetical protein